MGDFVMYGFWNLMIYAERNLLLLSTLIVTTVISSQKR